jgi:uncharacterized protein with HEPN domain
MNEHDLWRLRHMLDTATEAVTLAEGETRETLGKDRKLALALVAATIIIGEAASKIDKQTQTRHPQIEWADIIAMRHVLVHDYYRIDLDVVWDAIRLDLPELIPKLEEIIQSEQE